VGGVSWLDRGHAGLSHVGGACGAEPRRWDARGAHTESHTGGGVARGTPGSVDLAVGWVQVMDQWVYHPR
jgi:hypothetical protein